MGSPGRVGYDVGGLWVRTSSWRQGRRNGMRNSQRVRQEGDNYLTLKMIKDNFF